MKKQKWVFILTISILFQGCLAFSTPEGTQVVNNEMNTKIATDSTIPTIALTVPTEIPTLIFNEALEQSTMLLQNNNNCKLPCWWGITPGKTKWQEAILITAPLGGKITGDEIVFTGEGSIFVRPPAPGSDNKVLFHTYFIRNGIVSNIEVYNYDLAPISYFKRMIDEHGIPDEMYIRGHWDSGFRLALFYSEQGILAEYSRAITSSNEKNVRVCYEEANSPFLYLWGSNSPMTFEDAIIKLHVPIEDIPPFVSINEALINAKDFIESLEQTGMANCIETPKDIWPTKY